MAKITRKTAKLFCVTAAPTDVEQFGSFEALGAPNYTTDPAVIQALSTWQQGWTSEQYLGTFAPYIQDRNAVDLVNLMQLFYILEMGIGEWDSATTYYTNSVVQSGGGIYLSLQDNNTGNTPPASASNSFWRLTAFPSSFQLKSVTRTVFLNGSGTYTPPLGCVKIFVRLIGGGGGGGAGAANGNNGVSTTFGSLVGGGGGGGSGNTAGNFGTGGTASGGDINSPGQGGSYCYFSGTLCLNMGGNSRLGGGGPASQPSNPGINAIANTGGGGGGSGSYSGQVAGGGGAGGYVEKTILSPASTAYAVGAGGVAVSNGASMGGAGGNGIIIIDEFYY